MVKPRLLRRRLLKKDLGAHMTDTLKPTIQCSKAANQAMSVLRLLRMAFGHLNNLKTLYSVYVRPHLEQCIQATGLYVVQDWKALEKVQRRATKLVQGLRHTPYVEWLRVLDLTSVEERIRW